MADDNQIIYEYAVDTSQAEKQIRQLKKLMDEFTASFTANNKILQNRINAADTERQKKTVVRDFAAGNQLATQRDASTQRLIADIKKSGAQLEATYKNAMTGLLKDRIKAMDDQIAATIRRAHNDAKLNLQNNTSRALEVRSYLNQQRLANDEQRASFGNPYFDAKRSLQQRAADAIVGKAADVEYLNAVDSRNKRRRDTLVREEAGDTEYRAALEQRNARRKQIVIKEETEDADYRAAVEKKNARRKQTVVKEEAEDAEYRAARAKLAAKQKQTVIARAEALDNPVERQERVPLTAAQRNTDTYNRIADPSFIAVQGRIMANYAVLSQVFNAFSTVGSNVLQLEKELKNLQAITNATDGEMTSLTATVLDLGTKTRFSQVELAQASVILGQAGLSARQAQEALSGVALLATASGTDMARATDVLTSTLTVFNLQASQTTQIAQTLTAALNTSKLDIEKLALGIQYAGNIAADQSIPLEELVSILGALADSGIRGSTAGTGIRQLLLDLSTPTEKFQVILKRLGLSLSDIDIKTNGFVGVLSNLREAGFSSADAMNSFEVRAASAFSALQNNAGAIDSMRQALVLSSAATDAAETQMDSLSAAGSRLVNSMTAVAYQAFQPFSDLLKLVFNAAADALSVLSRYPTILAAIGTGLTTVGIVKGAMYIKNIVVGLLEWQAALKVLPARIAAVTVATEAATTATMAATGATTMLGRAVMFLSANPLILAATAIAGVVTAITLWNSSQEDLNTQLDNTRTRIASLSEDIDSTQQSVDSISDSIQDLGRNRKALEEDTARGGGMMKTRVLELQEAYSSLGLDIKNNATPSVKELVEALNNLRGDMMSKLPDFIQQKLDEMQTEVDLMKKETEGTLIQQNLPLSVGRLASKSYFQNKESKDLLPYERKGLQDLGPEFVRAVRLLMNAEPLPEEKAGFSKLINTLTKQSGSFAEGSDERNAINDLVVALKGLQDQVGNIQAKNIQIKEISQNKLDAEAAVKTQGLRNQVDAIQADSTADINNILKSTTDPILLQEKFKALKVAYDLRMKAISDGIETVRKELAESGASKSGVIRAIGSTKINDTIAAIDGALLAAIEGRHKDVLKLLKEQNKIDQSNVSKDIQRIDQRLRKARTREDIEAIQLEFAKAYDLKKKILQTAFDLDNKENEPGADILLSQKEAIRQIGEDEQATNQAIEEKFRELGERAASISLDLLEAQAETLKTKIEEAKQSINAKSPISAIKKIVDLVNGLTDQLVTIEKAITQTKLSSLPANRFDARVPSAAANDVMRMIIDGANARGLDPTTALAIARMESGFNPQAKNPNLNSSASGVYQILDGTYKQMGIGAGDPRRNSASGQVNAGLDLMVQFKQQLESRIGRAASSEDQYLAHLLGVGGYSKALGNPGGNAVSVLGASAVYGNRGTKNDTVADFLTRMRGIFNKNLEAVQGYTIKVAESETEKVKQEGDAALSKAEGNRTDVRRKMTDAQAKLDAAQQRVLVKSLNQEISTLTTQTKILKDPSNIKKMQETIKDKFDQMVDLELSAFDKENSDLKTSDPASYGEQRQALIDQINNNREQLMARMNDQYRDALKEEIYKPVDNLKQQLEYANKTNNEPLATQLQKQINVAEVEAAKKLVIALEREQIQAEKELADAITRTGKSSVETANAQANVVSTTERLTEAKKDAAAITGEGARAEMSMKSAIDNTTEAWLRQNGVIYGLNGQIDTVATSINMYSQAWTGVLDTLSGGFQQLFTDLVSGNKSVGDSFKDFAKNAIDSLISVFTKMASMQLMQLLFGGGGGGLGGGGAGIGGLFSGLFGGMAIGGTVRGGIPGRDSVPTLLEPGEVVLRKSAVDVIGNDKLTEINNLGNRRQSASNIVPISQGNNGSKGEVNVWVVQPDQIPPPGPNDIVAHVANNIQNRGSLKTLIKQVAVGAI